MNGVKINYVNCLAGILLISILFFPDIQLSASLPSFQVIDFLIPLIGLVIYQRKPKIVKNNYYFFLLFFTGYILFTIVINGRIGIVRDYFELYKFFKFLLLILFFSVIDVLLFLKTWTKPIFILLVIINLLHFFEIGNTNDLLLQYYNGGRNISYFGKNSLGLDAAKRMAGIVGNPNNNAIIFSFFMVYFFPFKLEKIKIYWFSLALLMVFMCQSRTTMIAFAMIIITVFIFKMVDWKFKRYVIFLTLTTSIYLIAMYFSSRGFTVDTYSNTVFSEDVLNTNSVMGRIETWKFLGNMILEKPFFGYGPNKDFFYDNHIYSESEYFLYAWRYGFVGLIMYLLIYLIPLKDLFYKKRTTISNYLLLITVLMSVSAITNNPFTERTVAVLFAASVGFLYQLTHVKQSNSQSDVNQ